MYCLFWWLYDSALVPNIVSITSSLDCSYSFQYFCFNVKIKKIIVIVIVTKYITKSIIIKIKVEKKYKSYNYSKAIVASRMKVMCYINIFIICLQSGASPGFGKGFSDLEICMSQSYMLCMAKPCAFLGVFGSMLPRYNFLKRCILVDFRVYFDQILSLFFKKKIIIFYIKNKYFRYTIVMGYFSWRNFWKHVTIDAFWCIFWN